ncbi:neuromedin-U receptor 2-like isoform X1 [Dermatophagoides pteronyssinus]|uniref:neuromedin-U receptor 2-like isoform X1 n=1 Tax=Dermatophagoides pteronyssinus TaxID=6956 RepID=UPI003F6792CE
MNKTIDNIDIDDLNNDLNDDYELLNITEHLYQHLGPQQALPLIWLIIMTIVYIIILISGLIGNIITILVIFRFRYMQTITNLYLCNLAITDLISLMFSLPLELYTLWHQYPWQLGSVMCSLKTLILEGTANASVLTLVAFTVERFLAICGSSKHQTLQPTTQTLFNFKSILHIKRLVYRNILLIWLISISGAIPLVLLTRVNYLETTNHHQQQKLIKQSAWCGLAYNVPDKRWELIMLSSTIIFFLIPLLIISCLYYKIAKKLKKTIKLDYNFNLQQSSLSNDYYGQQQQQQLNDHLQSRKIIQSRRIVIRMLVVIVIVFTFCWSPFHAQRLLFLYVTLYSSWNMFLRQINGILFLSAGCLYYLNSSLNPLIYSLLSTRFRAAFMLYVQQSCFGRHSFNSSGHSNSGGGVNGGCQSGQQHQCHQHHPQQQQQPRTNRKCLSHQLSIGSRQIGADGGGAVGGNNNNSINSSIILVNDVPAAVDGGNNDNNTMCLTNKHPDTIQKKIPSIVMTDISMMNNRNNYNHHHQKHRNNELQLPKQYHRCCKHCCHHHHHHQHHHSQNNFQQIPDNNQQQQQHQQITGQNSW